MHNYALVAYDPSALGLAGASVVRAAELLPGRFDLSFPKTVLSFLFINMVLGTLAAPLVLAIRTFSKHILTSLFMIQRLLQTTCFNCYRYISRFLLFA